VRAGAWFVLIGVLAALAAVYAIVLQLTGQHADAERFVEMAGSGIGTLLVLLLLVAPWRRA
jgi:fumarate reductase subunit D